VRGFRSDAVQFQHRERPKKNPGRRRLT
jgi:hypothetical protein